MLLVGEAENVSLSVVLKDISKPVLVTQSLISYLISYCWKSKECIFLLDSSTRNDIHKPHSRMFRKIDTYFFLSGKMIYIWDICLENWYTFQTWISGKVWKMRPFKPLWTLILIFRNNWLYFQNKNRIKSLPKYPYLLNNGCCI